MIINGITHLLSFSRAHLSAKNTPWCVSLSLNSLNSSQTFEELVSGNRNRSSKWEKSTYLDTVVAGRHPSVLDLDVRRGMCELALGVWPRTLVPLEFPADL